MPPEVAACKAICIDKDNRHCLDYTYTPLLLPNENVMIGLFIICHTELLTNVSLFIRTNSVLFWICIPNGLFYVIDCIICCCCFFIYILVFNSFAFASWIKNLESCKKKPSVVVYIQRDI